MLLLRRKQAIRCRLVAAYFGDTTLLSDSHTNRSRREWKLPGSGCGDSPLIYSVTEPPHRATNGHARDTTRSKASPTLARSGAHGGVVRPSPAREDGYR